ncbi:putative defense protein 3 [Halichondria panicea]|uniref:putative defense protein 3 n=1 Tax=Halichondria panicea TaxID=6063 RepID=UPI00312B63EC
MKLLIGVSLVMSSIGLLVEGYSSGAPAGACDSLSPIHLAQPQASDVPYAISLMPFYNASDNSFTFYLGRTYTLSIANATVGGTFRGFFVQARLMNDDTTRAGVFAPTGPLADQSRLSSCPINTDGVTHNSPADKDIIYFTWTAPMGNTGDIRFGFAVVETRMTYWANQRTGVVQQAPSTIVTTTTAAPGTTAEPATTTTQIQPTQTTLPTNNTMSTADTTVFVIAGVVSTGGCSSHNHIYFYLDMHKKAWLHGEN